MVNLQWLKYFNANIIFSNVINISDWFTYVLVCARVNFVWLIQYIVTIVDIYESRQNVLYLHLQTIIHNLYAIFLDLYVYSVTIVNQIECTQLVRKKTSVTKF